MRVAFPFHAVVGFCEQDTKGRRANAIDGTDSQTLRQQLADEDKGLAQRAANMLLNPTTGTISTSISQNSTQTRSRTRLICGPQVLR